MRTSNWTTITGLASLFVFTLLFYQPVSGQLNADFTVEGPRSDCNFLSAKFISLSTANPGSIVEYVWDFEIGTTSTDAPEISWSFSNKRKYTICLTVKDDQGGEDTECKEDYIEIFQQPIADFMTNNRQGCTPHTARFTDLSSSPNGEIVEWLWDVGGSNPVIPTDDPGQPIVTTYQNEDDFTISLIVTDDKGCTALVEKPGYISTKNPPFLDFEGINNESCDLPLNVNIVNQSDNDPDLVYHWNFGNGEEYTGYDPPTITYSQPGTYDVLLWVESSNNAGCIDSLVYEDFVILGSKPVEFEYFSQGTCAPYEVEFIPDSIPSDHSVMWDFGNGETSSDPNPLITYDEPGIYTVTLQLTRDGCPFSADYTREVEIFGIGPWSVDIQSDQVCDLPKNYSFGLTTSEALNVTWVIAHDTLRGNPVNKSFNVKSVVPIEIILETDLGCVESFEIAPLDVRGFSVNLPPSMGDCYELDYSLNASSNDGTDLINYNWQIFNSDGDIIDSHQSPNPTGMISDTGQYDVLLIVENELGCIDTVFAEDYLGVGEELDDISFRAINQISCLESGVQFEYIGSDLANSWLWDFGDSTTSTNENPTHFYDEYGLYTITLTAFHNGCGTTDSMPQYVEIIPPRADFKFKSFCGTSNNPFKYQFINASEEYDSLYWDFGDGSQITSANFEEEPIHEYPQVGSYEVSLTAFNIETGCEHTYAETIVIDTVKAFLQVSPNRGCAPAIVDFTNLSENEFSSDLYWRGALRDTLMNFDTLSHKFGGGGSINDIFLVATSEFGCVDTFYYPDSIYLDRIWISLEVPVDSVCIGQEVNFINTSVNVLGDLDVTRWTVSTHEGFVQHLPLDDTVNIFIEEPGRYTVVLSVEGPSGCTKDKGVEDFLIITDPKAVISADTTGCTGTDIFFVPAEGTDLWSYRWDFGDGATSNERFASHQFSSEGAFEVILEVWDQNGCYDVTDTTIRIGNPVADWDLDQSFTNCPPLIVQFENNSEGAISYEWDFGDNSGVSVSENPQHIYTRPGVYDVMLIAILSESCRDTMLIEEAVTIRGPEGQINFESDSSCAPLTLNFSATSTEPFGYVWDFGDGTVDSIPGLVDEYQTSHTYNNPGEYYPTLIMTNNEECRVPYQPEDPVIVSTLSAEIILNPPDVCSVPTTVYPEAVVQNRFGDSLIYEWTIVDQNTGNTQTFNNESPGYDINTEGIYEVTLEINNGYCSEILNYTIVAALSPPDAAMDLSTQNPCRGDSVTLTDASTASIGSIAAWAWIINGDTVSTNETFNYLFEPGQDYEVELFVSNELGCTESVIETIQPRQELQAEVDATYDVCKGGEIYLSGDPTVFPDIINTYWQSDAGVLCDPCTEITLTGGTEEILFEFVMEDAFGCSHITQIEADTIESGGPDVDLTIAQDEVCVETFVQLNVLGAIASDVVNWSTDAGALECIGADCHTVDLFAKRPGTVQATVTNQYGCETVVEVPVNVIDERSNFAGPDLVACRGEEVSIQVSNLQSVNWNTESGESCLDCNTFSFTPEASTTIFVEAVTSRGCEIRDTVEVEFREFEQLTAFRDTLICPGERIRLSGQGAALLNWSPQTYIVEQGDQYVLVEPTQDISYIVSAGAGKCFIPDTVHVEVESEATLQLFGDTVCPGEPAYISYEGNFTDIDWKPDNMEFEDSGPNEVSITLDQSLDVGAIAHFRECAETSAGTRIEVYEMPDPNFRPIYEIYPGESVDIVLELDTARYDLVWGPFSAELPCTFCTEFTVSPVEDTEYTLTIYDNQTGCEQTTILSIVMRRDCGDDRYYAPNAFSPNGDGNNDIYRIFKHPLAPNIESLQIFNRWGNKVFESRDINIGWDGTFQGEEAIPSVYAYILTVRCELNGELQTYSGDITLIR